MEQSEWDAAEGTGGSGDFPSRTSHTPRLRDLGRFSLLTLSFGCSLPEFTLGYKSRGQSLLPQGILVVLRAYSATFEGRDEKEEG